MDGSGSAEYLNFVEDLDPTAFNYAFSVGKVAVSGSFEKMEKEAKVYNTDPDEKVRNSLKVSPICQVKLDFCGSGPLTDSFLQAALRKRMKMDGTKCRPSARRKMAHRVRRVWLGALGRAVPHTRCHCCRSC